MIDDMSDEFLWKRHHDPVSGELTQLTKLKRIKGPLTDEDVKSFITEDDEINEENLFMLFTMDKEVMVGLNVPLAEEFDCALYRVYEVSGGEFKSIWVPHKDGEIVDFDRVVVDVGSIKRKNTYDN